MIRRPPRSTLDRSSAASDVYKRQVQGVAGAVEADDEAVADQLVLPHALDIGEILDPGSRAGMDRRPVSYTHLRAHETVLDLVCRLLLEKKKQNKKKKTTHNNTTTIKLNHRTTTESTVCAVTKFCYNKFYIR